KEPKIESGKNPDYVDLEKIADTTDGLSGADVASIANTAVSLVIHEFLNKYPDQKEAEKQATTAKVTMRHFEEAVRKVRTQKELKIGEKVAVPYYR
ncbi:MAG: AAA family ATPase, partial [Thermoproteota archaeon]